MHSSLPLFMAIPLGAAFLGLIIAKLWRGVGGLFALLGALFLTVFSFRLLGSPPSIFKMGGWIPPVGINLVSDGLSTFMLVIINTVAFLVIVFSLRYMDLYTAKPQYYALFMLMIAGMNGVALTGDMFNLFVFLEIASIASYALVAFGCEHEELEASFKYLILGGMASALILLGVAILYSTTGTLNMADMAQVFSTGRANKAALFALALLIMGFGVKGALVPFHAWLPDAHPSAPAPISAMLSGVLIKVLGIYALTRVVFNVFGFTPTLGAILMALGGLSMVVGALMAIGQDDLKRLLAYSTISQIGYVVLGLGLGTPLGIIGGLFHLLNHATFKSLLFMSSGAIEYSTGTRKLNQMGGLNRRLPVTTAASTTGFLSVSGIPPFNGFFSKLILIIACIEAHRYVYAAVAAFVGLFTLLYFMRVQRNLLFGDLPQSLKGIKEVPFLMGFSLVVLALLCLGLSFLYPLMSRTILASARDVLLNTSAYIKLVLGG